MDPDFALEVSGTKRLCPAGEKYAQENIADEKIPVLSCEGPCIRGEIARLAANIVSEEEPYARCCFPLRNNGPFLTKSDVRPN